MKRILGLLAGLALTASAGAFDFVAVGQYDQVPTKGYRTATLELSGTWVGNVVIVGSSSGANWVTLTAGTISVNGFTSVSTEGYNWIRARCSAYTSGTISGLLSQGNGDAGTGTVVSMTTPTIGGASSPVNGTMSRSSAGSITATVATVQSACGTGTCVELALDGSINVVSVNVANAGTYNLRAQYTTDGLLWTSAFPTIGGNSDIATPDNRIYNVGGAKKFRVIGVTYSSGSPLVTMYSSAGVNLPTAPGWSLPLTQTSYTGITTNANTTLSVTFTAGTAAYKQYLVELCTVAGATAVMATDHNTMTPPATFSLTNGDPFYLGDSMRPVGQIIENGGVNTAPCFSMVASALSGATSGTVFLRIRGR